jgi:hypothetical protein
LGPCPATIGWAAPATIAGLLSAAVLLLAFIRNEARAIAPLMPLRIFPSPGRSVSERGPLLERLGWAPIRSGIEKRHGMAGPSLSVEGRHDTEP